MENPKSSYFSVLFSSPGPHDIESEIQNIIPYLTQSNNLHLAKGFKMIIMVDSVSNPTDFKKLTEAMKSWLDGEDKALLARIKQVGINSHGNQYKFFQAGWTISMDQSTEALEFATTAEIQSTISAACLKYNTNKRQLSRNLLGAILDKLFRRATEVKTKNITGWQKGPGCSNCGQVTLLISETEASNLFMLSGVSDERRRQAPKTAYRCKECQEVSCLQCAFNTGESLNMSVPACPKCHSTQVVTIA